MSIPFLAQTKKPSAFSWLFKLKFRGYGAGAWFPHNKPYHIDKNAKTLFFVFKTFKYVNKSEKHFIFTDVIGYKS
jgi:hypothetical protein